MLSGQKVVFSGGGCPPEKYGEGGGGKLGQGSSCQCCCASVFPYFSDGPQAPTCNQLPVRTQPGPLKNRLTYIQPSVMALALPLQ